MKFANTLAFSSFAVDNLADAKEFYCKTLGLECIPGRGEGFFLQFPTGGRIFVYEKSDHFAAPYTVLNFPVENIDQALSQLKDVGVIFEFFDDEDFPQDNKGVYRGRSRDKGPDMAWFKDPAGNILSILQEA